MPDNNFAPFLKLHTSFIVKNISDPKKTIFIFNYPIPWDQERDLLAIPGVAEADIRASLLKGELQHKIRAHEIYVSMSDIDLLQFNTAQKAFLESAGIVYGTSVSGSQIGVVKHEDVELIGDVDGINTVFTIPEGKFLYTSEYKIIVYRNGVREVLGEDYFIAESGGVGTGYDTIIFNEAPQNDLSPIDIIVADYYILNS